ncbi:MAG: DUF4118 domain-containing protein [Oscillospiraceae bacterium]|nr:DUF4118 domain-containing protein [Oscillospiraceae bacterium]
MKKRLLSRLLPDRRCIGQDAAKTLLILLSTTAANFFMAYIAGDAQNASELYLLSVLLVSLYTTGYFWAFVCAAAGVVGTNFLFTYPYYEFNFSLHGYPVTFLCMLVVAGIAGTLAAGIKEQRNLSQIREEKTQQLNRVARQLLSAQSAEQIGLLAARCLSELLQCPACFYLSAETRSPFTCGEIGGLSPERELAAVQTVFTCNQPTGRGCERENGCVFHYFPVFSGQKVLAVAGIRPEREPLDEDNREFLQLLLAQFAMALERQHLSDERQQMVVEKQKEQMRGNLLRAISHDLRTPLTGILGASSAILENGERIAPQGRRQLIQDIHEDADWLLRMVENVLSVTRIGQGAPNLRKVPEAVEEVVAQAVNRCRKRLPGLSLTVRVPDEFIMAPMDGTLIEQVLINLIENAYKYGRSTQPIEVTVCAAGKNAQFVVRDHGPGIAPERLPAIFEGFLGRDGQDADSSRGLGIGLSICRSIITAHGGDILAENGADGGAQFTFTLPLEEETPYAQP